MDPPQEPPVVVFLQLGSSLRPPPLVDPQQEPPIVVFQQL